MDVPLACVAVVFAMVWVPRTVAARGQVAAGYDNHHPRDQQAKLEGAARRAHAAHLNTFEFFAPFAAGVLGCELRHVNPQWVMILALAGAGARVIYPFLYIYDKATPRSSVWTVGLLATTGLLLLAAFG